MQASQRSRSLSPLPASKRLRPDSQDWEKQPPPPQELKTEPTAAPSQPPDAAEAASSQQSISSILFHRQDYPRLFLQELDTTPTRFWAVPHSLPKFWPRLCRAPCRTTSPLSFQLRDPVCIVSLPFPANWRSVMAGGWYERSAVIAAVSDMHRSSFLLGRLRGDWSCLNAVGTAQQVDAVMECVFFLVFCERQRALRQPGLWPVTEDTDRLQTHMQDWWQQKRSSEQRSGQQQLFFSLQSRGLSCPELRPHPPPAVPRPEECRPCQAFGVRGCVAGERCPYTHLSFAAHFGLMASNIPVDPSDLADMTPEFRPVLALLPAAAAAAAAPSPSSSSRSGSARFVVCVPFPRLPWCWCVLRETSSIQRLFGSSLRLRPSCPPYHCGDWDRAEDDESVDWPRAVAVLSSLELVDEFMECFFWMMEDAHLLLQRPHRDADLDRRLQAFREAKTRWTGDRDSQLFSLEMRGLSLRYPPVPPYSAAVPAAAAHAAAAPADARIPAADAYRDGSSSSTSSSKSAEPQSSRSFYSSSESSSPPPKTAQRSPVREIRRPDPAAAYASDATRPDSSSSRSSGASSSWPARPPPRSERRRPSPSRSPPSRERYEPSQPAAPASPSSGPNPQGFDRSNYIALFVKHLDTSPVSFGQLVLGSPTFCPRLCPAPPMSSSPLSLHVLDPLMIVCFPFPAHYMPLITGRQGQHHRLLSDIAGVDRECVRMGDAEALPEGKGPAQVWAMLKAVGSMEQLDTLMEAFFLLIQRLQGLWRRLSFQSPMWQEELQTLEQKVREWKQRRSREFRTEELFFSLQSRGLRCPPLESPAPRVLPPPEGCRPCQSTYSVRGCQFEAHCPDSHLPYAQHIGLLSSNVPVLASDIPALTEQFAPVLALLPPSSSSPGGRYVVALPIPRLQRLLDLLTSCSPFQSLFGSALLSRASLARGSLYERSGESTGWLNVVAELEGLEAVDEFVECLLFFMEEAHHMRSDQERDSEMSRRQTAFRERKSGWTGDRERQLMSLEMRGVKLRRPPLPLPFPAVPPATAVHARKDESSSDSSSSGRSSSSISRSPPPAQSSHEASSPPRPPPKRAQASSDPQSEWAPLLREMKQRGLSVSYVSDVLIPDFSSSDAAFICCRADCVFACIPIPATEAVRSCVYHEQLDGLPDVTAIEQEHGVDVFVPRLVDDDGRTRNEQRLPWLNVCVKREQSGPSVDALDAALRSLISRCRRALMSEQQLSHHR